MARKHPLNRKPYPAPVPHTSAVPDLEARLKKALEDMRYPSQNYRTAGLVKMLMPHHVTAILAAIMPVASAAVDEAEAAGSWA